MTKKEAGKQKHRKTDKQTEGHTLREKVCNIAYIQNLILKENFYVNTVMVKSKRFTKMPTKQS